MPQSFQPQCPGIQCLVLKCHSYDLLFTLKQGGRVVTRRQENNPISSLIHNSYVYKGCAKIYALLSPSILWEAQILGISRTLRDPLGSSPKQHKYMLPDGFWSILFYEEFYNHLIKENSIIPISLGEMFDFPKAKGIPFKISSCPQHWCGIWIIPQHRWQWGTLNLIAFTHSPYTEPFFFPSIHSLFIA